MDRIAVPGYDEGVRVEKEPIASYVGTARPTLADPLSSRLECVSRHEA